MLFLLEFSISFTARHYKLEVDLYISHAAFIYYAKLAENDKKNKPFKTYKIIKQSIIQEIPSL